MSPESVGSLLAATSVWGYHSLGTRDPPRGAGTIPQPDTHGWSVGPEVGCEGCHLMLASRDGLDTELVTEGEVASDPHPI